MAYESSVDALRLRGGRYFLTVVSSGDRLSPQCIARASLCHYVLSKLLGDVDAKKLGQCVAIIRNDGREETLDISRYFELLATQRSSFVDFLRLDGFWPLVAAYRNQCLICHEPALPQEVRSSARAQRS